ncbi:MAG: hypothetical protein IT269_07560 [Saprospiraceae bacterium]|nr:hypothetical protein [Saprospiraceae bacterium]
MLRYLLPIFCLSLSGLLHAQQFIIPDFDLDQPDTLLSVFFDSRQFAPTGHVLWQPANFEENISMDRSADGWVHTRIDTILYYSTFGIKRAVVVFETLEFDAENHVLDCHACDAKLSVAVFTASEGGRWQVDRFQKHFTSLGSDGQNGELDLTRFGPETWCLTMRMDWYSQGVYGEYVSFYDLDNLQKVFNFVEHEDNSGAFGDVPERNYALDKSIHFLTNVDSPSGWWEFDLVARGTQPDDDILRAVPANLVERYAYNWETNTYMKVCR